MYLLSNRLKKLWLLLTVWLVATLSLHLIAKDHPNWRTNEPITPIPNISHLDPKKVELGKKLFHDPKLSADGSVACANCHNLSLAGTDGLATAIGIKGLKGERNTPTVLNTGLNFRQFWDGRSPNLEDQVTEPITNPIEMGNTWENVISYISGERKYLYEFHSIYREKPNSKNISNAIAEFEKSLLTPNGAFDRFLKGDDSAISDKAKEGYELFKSFGCVSCHQGVAVGGNLYEKLGVIIPYYLESESKSSNFGRYRQTGVQEHKFEFKVPSLRNVARTAPYLHDGSIKSLNQIVVIMAKHQLGRELSQDEVERIVAFLKTLNGPLNAK